MSISSTLLNAQSGLVASSRAAEVVSSNVANASTPGYAARDIELTSGLGDGGGVRVAGISRRTDSALRMQRLEADADNAGTSARASFFANVERLVGIPGEAGSITDLVDKFQAALIGATSRPDSEVRLQAVLDSAKGISFALKRISDSVQAQRMQADSTIGKLIGQLDTGLQRIRKLNEQIGAQIAGGHDASTLIDRRAKEIDSIATIVPLRVVQRDNGQISLFTKGGAVLLDGTVTSPTFSPSGVIVPQMSVSSGGLSTLQFGGRMIDMHSDGRFRGGELEAQFQIRDDLAPTIQMRLDGLARDLVERFSDPAVDPSGGIGLFTDGGGSFAASNELGLSARLAVNPAADPALGGSLSKLRDGMGPGPARAPGDATQLLAYSAALTAARAPVSGGFSPVPMSASGLAADTVSFVSTRRLEAENEVGFSSARLNSLQDEEHRLGVDSDRQMQNLLLIEQAYGANARVIKTADEMIQTLLGL